MNIATACILAAVGISLAIISTPTSCVCANEWVELSPMNRRRGEHGNAVVGGKFFVIGGISSSSSGPNEIEQFDPVTNEWTDIGTMPMTPTSRSRHHFTIGSSVYGEEIWIVGGKLFNDSSGTKYVDVYNANTGEWRLGPDLPEIMWGGPSVIVGDVLHAFAGAQSRTSTEGFHFSLNLTEPEADWQSEIAVPFPRVHVAGATIGDNIYLLGGEFHHSHDGDTTTVQIYDTTNQSWSTGADLPLPRSHSEWATFTHEGEIWSVSGVDSSKAPNRGQSEIFIYNPNDDQWRQFQADLPGDLVSPGAKIIDDTLYVFGGGVNDWFEGDMQTTYALSLVESLGGDFNHDGVINGADFLLWQRGDLSNPLSISDLANWQASFGKILKGDYNHDGVVSGADFLLWQRGDLSNPLSISDLEVWQENFGNSTFLTPIVAANAIPEPDSLLLLRFGVMVALLKRPAPDFFMR